MKKAIFLYILLSILASAINYAAYPLLGRILPADQYIDITVALSILTQITTFLSSIIAITIGLTKEEKTDTKKTLTHLQSVLFKLFLGLIAVFLVASPFIFSAIDTPLKFCIPIALMMLISLPMTIISGYLNGKQLMVKLGTFTVISATFQLIVGTSVGLLAKDGFTAMISMSLAQLGAVSLTYFLYRADSPPNPLHVFDFKNRILTSNTHFKKIVIYTAAASIAIMAINLAQIVDLLIITAKESSDAKFYTDLYVVSRVMFFAGMIFIWPFLAIINTRDRTKNKLPLLKLVAIFTLIAGGLIGTLLIIGPWLIHLLLGVWYGPHEIFVTGSLAILFKLFLLIITAITLYFMVFRHYAAVVYALILVVLLGIYSGLHSEATSTLRTLTELTFISFAWAIVGFVLYARHVRANKL